MTSLYRKYRPQTFDQVVGQSVVVHTLENALIHDVPSHSYLFTGPRGTGKTSLARIFAKALNCQKRKKAVACNQCAHCLAFNENQSLDILEIDAASYTGVDNIRSLRETMNNAPVLGKYKIFIIDEVHMLSLGAFNALLKVMEEPPSHVVFLLATTEIHKVPKTIISRCQKFDLRKFTSEEIVSKLEMIAEKEKIKAEKDALVLIAVNSGGSLRDAESLFTQLHTLHPGKLTAKVLQINLGLSDNTVLYTLLQAFAKNDIQNLLFQIKQVEENGKSPTPFTSDLIRLCRNIVYYKASQDFTLDPLSFTTKEEQSLIKSLAAVLTYKTLASLIEALEAALLQFKTSAFGFLPLEIALIKNFTLEKSSPKDDDSSDEDGGKAKLHKKEKKEKSPSTPLQKDSGEVISKVSLSQATESCSVNLEKIQAQWQSVIERVKLLNASVSVALQSARPIQVEGNTLTIGVKYKFHQERLSDPVHRLTLSEAFGTILGTQLAFSIVEDAIKSEETEKSANEPLVQHALELLGGTVI